MCRVIFCLFTKLSDVVNIQQNNIDPQTVPCGTPERASLTAMSVQRRQLVDSENREKY